MRYLLFGASTTLGVGDPEHGGWSTRLQLFLDKKSGERYFHNLAISGDTSRGVRERIHDETIRRLRDKPREEWTIILSIGTNDSRLNNGEKFVDEAEFEENLRAILTTAQSLVGRVVFVSGWPIIEEVCNPFKGHIEFTNKRIQEYSQITQRVLEEFNVSFIDVYTPLSNYPTIQSLQMMGFTQTHEVIN